MCDLLALQITQASHGTVTATGLRWTLVPLLSSRFTSLCVLPDPTTSQPLIPTVSQNQTPLSHFLHSASLPEEGIAPCTRQSENLNFTLIES